MTAKHPTPLTVLGVSKTHAQRAITYMSDRNLLAFYAPKERALCAFEFKHGREWTYNAMTHALLATRA